MLVPLFTFGLDCSGDKTIIGFSPTMVSNPSDRPYVPTVLEFGPCVTPEYAA